MVNYRCQCGEWLEFEMSERPEKCTCGRSLRKNPGPPKVIKVLPKPWSPCSGPGCTHPSHKQDEVDHANKS